MPPKLRLMSIEDLAMYLLVTGEMGFLSAAIGNAVPMPGVAYAAICLSLFTIGLVCVTRNYLDAHEITDADIDAYLRRQLGA